MDYGKESVQKNRQVIDCDSKIIIRETRTQSTECEFEGFSFRHFGQIITNALKVQSSILSEER